MRPFLVVAVVTAVLGLAIGVKIFSEPNENDIRRALQETGCKVPEAEYTRQPGRTVLAVSALTCQSANSKTPATRSAAVEMVARVVWSAPAYDVDVVFVTVYRGANDDGQTTDPPKEFRRADLEVEFGPRQVAAGAYPTGERITGSEVAARTVPVIAVVVGGLFAISVLRGLYRGQISLIFFLR
jgi:hypothetical protein